MANSDGIDDSELPTKPLPVDEPVAGHVPLADLPTAPLIPVDEGLASPAQSVTPAARGSGRRVWPWVIVGVLAAAAIVAVIVGLNLGGRGPTPVPSTSLSSSPATPMTPSPSLRKGGATPSQSAANPPPSQPTQPSAPPTPTVPPAPTDTPSP